MSSVSPASVNGPQKKPMALSPSPSKRPPWPAALQVPVMLAEL